MASELQNLDTIFNSRLFRIPDYQRGYAWELSHLKAFWDDLLRLGEHRKHYTGQLTIEAWYAIQVADDADWVPDQLRAWLERVSHLGLGASAPLLMAILLRKGTAVDLAVKCVKEVERFIFVVGRFCKRRSDTGDSEFYHGVYQRCSFFVSRGHFLPSYPQAKETKRSLEGSVAGGGGEGKTWIVVLVVGAAMIGGGMFVHAPGWLHAGLLGIGGLAVVFGSCEALLKSVDGVGERLGWNPFVAGTMGGLASNVPELVMLGFVLAAAPRVGFIVTALTLHLGALMFGLYSGLLPRDPAGRARLPAPLVKISSDLYVIAACMFLGTGLLMLSMRAFSTDAHGGSGLGVLDLWVLGCALLFVQVVSTTELLKRFRGEEIATGRSGPGWGKILGCLLLGLVASVIGGHAVGDFADILVASVEAAGYPPMVGAITLSLFASAGAMTMVATSHLKGKHDVALAAASGQVTQVPFVVLPVALLLLAVLAQAGVITRLPSGAVLPIDLETTSVMLLSFPPMLLLWKAAQDDGHVSWLETAGMVCVFGIVVYLLAAHG